MLSRTIVSSDPLDLSAGAYTIEAQMFNRDSAGAVYFGTTYLSALMLIATAGSLATQVDGVTLPAATVSIGSYNHVAVVMDASNNASVYIDGIASGSPTPISRSSWAGNLFYIGGTQFGSSLAGTVDEFRITKGVARYLSNFTPPAAPFPSF